MADRTLRELAQAAVDARERYETKYPKKTTALAVDSEEWRDLLSAEGALRAALGYTLSGNAKVLLDALKAERSAALEDVRKYAEREAKACFDPRLRLNSKGDAFEHVARWCAAEREKEER